MELATRKQLLSWFESSHRPLPWRSTRDPYAIWVSEVMLQQTTARAVIPFYTRFMLRFPTLADLARAQQKEVNTLWAGLGYYARAKALLKSAQALHARGQFPQSFRELIDYPGFGPYTARAVASQAFGESVGVLDGNVIRVVSRWTGRATTWWTVRGRSRLQDQVDQWVKDLPSDRFNQSLMELGATVCTPQSPSCWSCPVRSTCRGHAAGTVHRLPRPKPRRATEAWVWRPEVLVKRGRIMLVQSRDLPFLKDHWVLPGTARKVRRRPSRFDFRHGITHHDLYVILKKNSSSGATPTTDKKVWVPVGRVPEWAPSSLIRKTLQHAEIK
jgi:A/G-specific adenine glycosylase